MIDTRLDVFALKPAPIQCTWLGSAWTSGLKTIDYVFFDPYLAPKDTLSSEAIVRLADCFISFEPKNDETRVSPAPCLSRGYVTFGYSGRVERLNDRVFSSWASILRRLPDARLVLDFGCFAIEENQAHYRGILEKNGVDTQRVIMRCSKDILVGLSDIDILLDCFPHSGGTMILDAIWAGVPFITLAERPPLGRIGTSFASNLGLPQLVAQTEAEYIELAVKYASHPSYLAQLRASMRDRFKASPLSDGAAFAKNMEFSWSTMWKTYCDGLPPKSFDTIKTEHGYAIANDQKLEQYQTLTKADMFNDFVKAMSHADWATALELARGLINIAPHDYYAWKALATSSYFSQRFDDAVQAASKAALLNPNDFEIHDLFGLIWIAKNDLSQAEKALQEAWRLNPNTPQIALHFFALFTSKNTLALAEPYLEAALPQATPEQTAQIMKGLGDIRFQQGAFIKAVEYYTISAQIHKIPDAQLQLALTLNAAGDIDSALETLDDAIRDNGHFKKALLVYASLCLKHHRLDKAQDMAERYIAIDRNNAVVHALLAEVFYKLTRYHEAKAAIARAIELEPHNIGFLNQLAVIHSFLRETMNAGVIYKKALALDANHLATLVNYSEFLLSAGEYLSSHAITKKAVALYPNDFQVLNNHALVCSRIGLLDESVSVYKAAIGASDGDSVTINNLLFTINYHPEMTGQEIISLYRHYLSNYVERPLSIGIQHPVRKASKIRLGYISGDFRKHAIFSFIYPLIQNHNFNEFEIYLYAHIPVEDEVSRLYQALPVRWINVASLSDQQLAHRITDDEIDILIDLAGHTKGNRLNVFSYRPAPVQISWLGYGYSTGLKTVDYYLADPIFAPQEADAYFSETILRIDHPSMVFSPVHALPDVTPLPLLKNGYITFGTLSRSIRLNDRVMRAWSFILGQIPRSRLIINSNDFRSQEMQDWIKTRFEKYGIDRDRIIAGYDSPAYTPLRDIDIMLDCFPHNSGTTLFESLLMGVPFVTRADRPSLGRIGAMILREIDESNLIATSDEQYIEIVLDLSKDQSRLVSLRETLRKRYFESRLADHASLAKVLEEKFKELHRQRSQP